MRRAPVRDTAAMIAGMAPELDGDIWHFCTVEGDRPRVPDGALASFREAEGLSVILGEADAARHGLPRALPMRRITLRVHSALDGVGLTAAVAGILAREGIPCNMVAACRHDHVFVPASMAERALALLRQLAGQAKGGVRDDTGQGV